jgi:hypothetical protein
MRTGKHAFAFAYSMIARGVVCSIAPWRYGYGDIGFPSNTLPIRGLQIPLLPFRHLHPPVARHHRNQLARHTETKPNLGFHYSLPPESGAGWE